MVDYNNKRNYIFSLVLIVLVAALECVIAFGYGDILIIKVVIGVALMVVGLIIRYIVEYISNISVVNYNREERRKKIFYIITFVPAFLAALYNVYLVCAVYIHSIEELNLEDNLINIFIFIAVYMVINAITNTPLIDIFIQNIAWPALVIVFIQNDSVDFLEKIMLFAISVLVAVFSVMILMKKEKKYIYVQKQMGSARRPYFGAAPRIISLVITAVIAVGIYCYCFYTGYTLVLFNLI